MVEGGKCLSKQCPLWVKSRHCISSASCPLYPQKRTLIERVRDVRFVPGADSCNATKRILFDYLIGAAKQCDRKAEPQRLRSLKIDDQFNFALLYNWQVADPFAF
jgi:hypothetical protein